MSLSLRFLLSKMGIIIIPICEVAVKMKLRRVNIKNMVNVLGSGVFESGNYYCYAYCAHSSANSKRTDLSQRDAMNTIQ